MVTKTLAVIPVNMCIDPEQLKWIDEQVVRERLFSRSAFMRRLIDLYFSQEREKEGKKVA